MKTDAIASIPSRQLRAELHRIEEMLERSDAMLKLVAEFGSAAEGIEVPLSKIMPSAPGNARQPFANRAREIVSKAGGIARAWDLEDVVLSLKALIDEARSIYHQTKLGPALELDRLYDSARGFLDAYKEFQKDYSDASAYLLLLEAEELTSISSYLKGLTVNLLSILGGPGRVDSDQAVLELHLPTDSYVTSVLETLRLLNELYEIVYAVVGTEDTEIVALEVRRFEGNTTWWLLVGWRSVIAILRPMFKTALKALTRRGQAETVVVEIDAALRVADYADALSELGGDAEPLIRALQDAAPVLADRFASLFAQRQGIAYVDGEAFQVDGGQRALPAAERRALPPAREYRRRKGGAVWHFCPSCSNWPIADYEVCYEEPQDGRLDTQCVSKERRGLCR